MNSDVLVVRPEGPIRPDAFDEVRCALAIAAAAVGVLIALYQRHFTLHLYDRHSFYLMTTHRCGLVMLAAMAWMTCETVSLSWKRSWRVWAPRG